MMMPSHRRCDNRDRHLQHKATLNSIAASRIPDNDSAIVATKSIESPDSNHDVLALPIALSEALEHHQPPLIEAKALELATGWAG